jgi:Uncharacterized conserved protein
MTENKPCLREDVMLKLNAKYPVMKNLFGIRKIGIFGSVARGEETGTSDVDIEVEFEPADDTFHNYYGLLCFLEELLGKPVDLVTTRVLDSYIRPDVSDSRAELNRDRVYITQILDEILFLIQRSRTITYKEFVRDEIVKRAVARSLEIIGESAHNLSPSFREAHTGIPWDELVAMRYRLIHMYFGVDWHLAWDILERQIPALEPSLRYLLRRM